MKKTVILILALTVAFGIQAQVRDQDYTVDSNGDVLVTKIVEGISLTKREIYVSALSYMKNAYKDTKYNIVVNSAENCVIVGEGEYLQFYEASIFPYSYFLNAPFQLRVDAKDGRARVSIRLSYYTGKRTNLNESIDVKDRISEFQPVDDSKKERRKLYNKAFLVLYQKSQKTLNEVEEELKKTQSDSPITDW